ncbi:MAG: hypothetical protein HYV27_18285 [Candidatus Hydrogenedentes bacterium]|nr:hypothetical protein [Candidatus Hydrogenedentota bacterium]
MVDLRNRDALATRGPLLIAHRGGVVSANSPECSPAAIRAAAEAGYDLVELDLQESSDQLPMVFHDPSLKEACGVPGSIFDHTAAELESIRFLANGDPLLSLDAALALCKSLGLGVMLDCKKGESGAFFKAVRASVDKHGLGRATMCINGDARIRLALKKAALLTLSEPEWASLRQGGRPPLSERFWFGLPRDLDEQKLQTLKAAGILIIPAINIFRYEQTRHLEDAAADVTRMNAAGVHGFQIDSVYQHLFGPKPVALPAGQDQP